MLSVKDSKFGLDLISTRLVSTIDTSFQMVEHYPSESIEFFVKILYLNCVIDISYLM